MEQLEFSQTIDGLFLRGLDALNNPVLLAKLKAKGLDLSRPLEPAYPASLVAACLQVAAEVVYPSVPKDQALNRVGRAFFRGYTDTMMGKAMLALMKIIGPMRTLERMQRNFRTGNNYIETRFRVIGQTHAELWFNQVYGAPTYIQGILEAGAVAIEAKDMVVTFREAPESGTWFNLVWSR